MSDTDPDLKSTEGNKPIAIDVVGGNLVIKRHNGREESHPMGGGDSSILPAPGYVTATLEDAVIPPLPNIAGMSYSEISMSPGNPTVPWDYSSTGVDWLSTDGNPPSPLDLGDGICVAGDGNLAISESGLYFLQANLFISQGAGDTGDDQVGDFLGQVYINNAAPFSSPEWQVEQSVKNTNLSYAYITVIVPIWEILLQPLAEVTVSIGHSSTGTLTANGQIMLLRVS